MIMFWSMTTSRRVLPGCSTILAAERLKRSRQTGLIGFIRKLVR